MTTDDEFDRQIQAYLESGPAELADRVLWAARAQLKTTRRRRPGFAWLAPWRNTQMTQNTRLLLVGGGALAIVVAIGAGLFGSIFARPNPGPAASAAQSAPGSSATPSAPSSSVAPGPSSSIVSARAPGWSATGGMTEARSGHTATLLLDGKVLVAGGWIGPDGSGAATSAELYDPSSGTWSATGSMHDGRARQTATLLQDGTVLVAGGASSRDAATAELYDPSSGTWTATGDMLAAGRGHTATLLPNGYVLVVGASGNPTLAELYDPANGTWTATGRPMIRWHNEHTATLLSDGRVLVAGGGPSGRDDGSPTAELYDPSTGSWTLTGNMVGSRQEHTATLLPDGRVLVAGGRSEVNSTGTASTEVYDPGSGSWTATGDMIELRTRGWTATALTDGRVLVAGGFNRTGVSVSVLASAEVYDPGTQTWTTAPKMGTARAEQTATLLPGGQVLVAGGDNVISGLFSPVASAELYDPGVGN
jgi:hypothetical protein